MRIGIDIVDIEAGLRFQVGEDRSFEEGPGRNILPCITRFVERLRSYQVVAWQGCIGPVTAVIELCLAIRIQLVTAIRIALVNGIEAGMVLPNKYHVGLFRIGRSGIVLGSGATVEVQTYFQPFLCLDGKVAPEIIPFETGAQVSAFIVRITGTDIVGGFIGASR